MKSLAAAAFAALVLTPSLHAASLDETGAAARRIVASAQRDANRRVYDEGGIRVVEVDDGGPDSPGITRGRYIDGATVIAASAEKKAQFAMLLRASVVSPGVPMRWAVPSMDTAGVVTLEEYIGNLQSGFQRNKAEFERANPGTPYMSNGDHITETERELRQQLQGRDAVVLRYIHIRRTGEAAR